MDRPFTESTPLSFVVFVLLALPAARPKTTKIFKTLAKFHKTRYISINIQYMKWRFSYYLESLYYVR